MVFKPDMKCSTTKFALTAAQDHPFEADWRTIDWSTPGFNYCVHTPKEPHQVGKHSTKLNKAPLGTKTHLVRVRKIHVWMVFGCRTFIVMVT